MSISSVYGRIVTGDLVREAVVTHLQTWMPAYIAEIARQRGRTTPPPIRSWAARVDFTQLAGETTPMLVVVAPGLANKPRRMGDGNYEVDWAVGIGVVTMADTEEHTMELAELYTAAARAAMLQHGSVSGLAVGVSWEDERYDDRTALNMRPDDIRTVAAGQSLFIVAISDVTDAYGGPVAPPDNVGTAPPDWPTANTVIVQVDKE